MNILIFTAMISCLPALSASAQPTAKIRHVALQPGLHNDIRIGGPTFPSRPWSWPARPLPAAGLRPSAFNSLSIAPQAARAAGVAASHDAPAVAALERISASLQAPSAPQADASAQVGAGIESFDGGTKSPITPAASEGSPAPQDGPGTYRKNDIANARFGTIEQQALIRKAMMLKEMVDKKIIGQERATSVLQARLVQYFEGFGSRTQDPIAAHIIGLPGIGKTAILDAIEQLGFTVERINVQRFAKDGGIPGAFEKELQDIALRNTDNPYILLIDELDKLPEIVKGDEQTVPFIGALSQILNDGYFTTKHTGKVSFSNAMIVTTMNFSPKEIETFSASVLPSPKSYYDFSIEDFAAFDEWIQKDPSARYKLLSRLFRTNSVGRLAPNTIIMKPLSAEDYVKIIKLTADATVEKTVKGARLAKRVSVSMTKGFEDFLYQHTVFAPSGARETISKVNVLIEQLINFGTKATAPGSKSLNQPRRLTLDFDAASGNVSVTVTPLVSRRGKLAAQEPFTFSPAYDPGSKLFIQPKNLAVAPPKPVKQSQREKPLSKKAILAARFPKTGKKAAGLAKKIGTIIFGQEETARFLEAAMNAYRNRPGPVEKNPPFLVLPGFTGIGKSEIAVQTAKLLGMPLVSINLQGFGSDSTDALVNFAQTLADAVDAARKRAPDGKFIVLIEELDKVNEISSDGKEVTRPIMGIIKSLLNDGTASVPGKDTPAIVIDVRDAYNIITLNIPVKRFGFEADPRLTTIEDTRRAARILSRNPAALKQTLGAMFREDTVGRLLSRCRIMMPVDEKAYRKIIAQQAGLVVDKRLSDPKTKRNNSLLSIQMTPAYRNYLFSETVIPSEGARNTVLESERRISTHLEEALARVPRNSAMATQPATLLLDYKPNKAMVIASLLPKSGPSKKQVIYRQKVALTFPPLAATGRMPEKRHLVTAHEFGHAFTAVRLGLRFEHIIVVPPKENVGGYVKFLNQDQSARVMLAKLYSDLGSRAMERILRSEDPRSELSVLDITPGPRTDIKEATKELWNMIYELGFDPKGGTIERMGVEGISQYAFFPPISPDETRKLGRILRRMENALVDDLLKAHDRDWYREKVARLARAGGMKEAEFYALVGHPHPGANAVFLGEKSRLADIFADQVEKPAPETIKARDFKQDDTKTTAIENLNAFLDRFVGLLKEELHPEESKR